MQLLIVVFRLSQFRRRELILSVIITIQVVEHLTSKRNILSLESIIITKIEID